MARVKEDINMLIWLEEVKFMIQILGRFGRLFQTLKEGKNKKEINVFQHEATIKEQGVVPIPSETSECFEQMSQVLVWLTICLSEGHIEPSQPCVGKIVGWPLRPFFKNSLYVDFEIWCFTRNLSKREVLKREPFYHFLDKIFISDGEKYRFPPLEECKASLKEISDQNNLKKAINSIRD